MDKDPLIKENRLALLSSAMQAISTALEDLQKGKPLKNVMPFADVRKVVGFDDYYTDEQRYNASRRD